MPDVSVAICTWNRAKLLDQTLAEMRKLRLSANLKWELLVVNNNSTDETDEVINRYSKFLPIRPLFEPNAGQSNARNCAVQAATGDLMLWTDDDVLVDANWMVEYLKAARQWPDAAFFGGTIEPWFAVEPPNWIRRNLHHLEHPFAIRRLGSDTRSFSPNEYPYGANMAFRTRILKDYPFNPKLGLVQNDTIRGDEFNVIERLIKHGYKGVWVGSARVLHYIVPERLTRTYIWDYYRGYGKSEIRQCAQKDWKLFMGMPRWLWKQYWLARLKSGWFAP
ncbi:MAG TPA: glycosyltransferase, partial [Gemmataceae bacterium]|nr:glycosyltransferase [Gemmataceae bacterium]